MAKTVAAEIRVADLLQMSQVIGVATVLLRELAKCDDLPEPVTVAMEQLRRDVEALSPDAPSDEDRIRDAMAEALDHPGRTITR